MAITSTQPSSLVSAFQLKDDVNDSYEMDWTSSLEDQAVYDILEQEFYPFKKVCFLFLFLLLG